MLDEIAREVFAQKAGYKREEIRNFRVREDGSAVGIIPTGQKIIYSVEEMTDYAKVMIARMETKTAPPAEETVTRVPTLAEALDSYFDDEYMETEDAGSSPSARPKKDTSKPKKDTSKRKKSES